MGIETDHPLTGMSQEPTEEADEEPEYLFITPELLRREDRR
jgi:hypothetical protein